MRVADLSVAPVKGLRTTGVDAVELTPRGPAGDRELVVVDSALVVVPTRRAPRLAQVAQRWDGDVLELAFPGGLTVRAEPRPGPAAATELHGGRRVTGRLVAGPLADALSEHLAQPVRLLALDAGQVGADDHPVSMMCEPSLASLAAAMGLEELDRRRFRMTMSLDGLEPWEERGWDGRRIRAGDAELEVVGPVPRCVVTTRSPASGERDAPVLRALAELHGRDAVEFGVWCRVVRPGIVRLGDPLIYKS